MRWSIKAWDTRGRLLGHTTHRTDTSKEIEIEVWRDRMARGDDVGRVEAIRLGGDPKVETYRPGRR